MYYKLVKNGNITYLLNCVHLKVLQVKISRYQWRGDRFLNGLEMGLQVGWFTQGIGVLNCK